MFFLAASLIASVIVATGLLAIFWRDIQSTFLRMFEKVKQLFSCDVEGGRIFLTQRQGQVTKVLKTYHRDQAGIWHETIARKNVAENEIPEEYRQRVQHLKDMEELDMTEEMQMQLSA